MRLTDIIALATLAVSGCSTAGTQAQVEAEIISEACAWAPGDAGGWSFVDPAVCDRALAKGWVRKWIPVEGDPDPFGYARRLPTGQWEIGLSANCQGAGYVGSMSIHSNGINCQLQDRAHFIAMFAAEAISPSAPLTAQDHDAVEYWKHKQAGLGNGPAGGWSCSMPGAPKNLQCDIPLNTSGWRYRW